MPSADAIKNLNYAKDAMVRSQKELIEFLNRSGRFTPEAIAEHNRLVDVMNQRTAEYTEAFKLAASS